MDTAAAIGSPVVTPQNDNGRALYARFVTEYLKDYDPVAAAMRIGYQHAQALDIGPTFLKDSYVQKQIEEVGLNELDDPGKLKRKIKLMLMREANYQGLNSSHAARVTALSKLHGILQEETSATEEEGGASGGVMVVPEMGSVNEWETEAITLQATLKKSVKE